MKIEEFLLLIKQFKDTPKQVTDKAELAHWTSNDWKEYYYVFDIGNSYRFEITDGPNNLLFGLFYSKPEDNSTRLASHKFYRCLFHDKGPRMNKEELFELLDKMGITLDDPNMLVNISVKERRDLLYMDLCFRLPFEPQAEITSAYDGSIETRTICACRPSNITSSIYLNFGDGGLYPYEIDNVKLLLRPLSDMADKEKAEFSKLLNNEVKVYSSQNTIDAIKVKSEFTLRQAEWLLKHQFDFRGLIQTGLAKECTLYPKPEEI